jgi:hypothetical protein
MFEHFWSFTAWLAAGVIYGVPCVALIARQRSSARVRRRHRSYLRSSATKS